MSLITPVAFFIFNRPDVTRVVFDEIAKAQPATLLVIADGPRSPEEREACEQARAIVSGIDWPCHVMTEYAETNLGCKKRISSGLDWVFSLYEEAIILEDDCVPHPSFFRYCSELLEMYRNDPRVMAISGDNFLFSETKIAESYYFSIYAHVWGWATWKRAWQHYDVNMSQWPILREKKWLRTLLKDDKTVKYWDNTFQEIYTGQIDTWDAQWLFACWQQGGLTALPSRNLIANIGFDDRATHTKISSKVANMPAEPMGFPLKHPLSVEQNAAADTVTFNQIFRPDLSHINPIQRFKQALLNVMPNRIRRALLQRKYWKHFLHPVRSSKIIYGIFFREVVIKRFYSRLIKRQHQTISRDLRETCWCGGELLPFKWHASYGVCKECGTYVNTKPPRKQELEQIYSLDNYWRIRQKLKGHPAIEDRSDLYRKDGRLNQWLDLINRYGPSEGKVVEVGCAPGVLLQELSLKGYQCTGVEINKDVAEWLSHQYQFEVIAGFFPGVSIPRCNLFLSFDVLEHVPSPQEFMNAVSQALLPNAVAIIQTGIDRYDFEPPFGARFDMFDDLEHMYLYTNKAMRKMGEAAGLEILSLEEQLYLAGEVCVFRKPAE